MEQYREKIEELKTMNCPSSERSIKELEAEGWQEAYSFHKRIKEQWNMACDEVADIKKSGEWEAVVVDDENEAENKDTIAYIYKRRIEESE